MSSQQPEPQHLHTRDCGFVGHRAVTEPLASVQHSWPQHQVSPVSPTPGVSGGAVMGGPRRTDKRGRFMWTSTLSQGAAGGSQGSMAMKFRPPKETPREETKGKLPCAEATSVQQVPDTTSDCGGRRMPPFLTSFHFLSQLKLYIHSAVFCDNKVRYFILWLEILIQAGYNHLAC